LIYLSECFKFMKTHVSPNIITMKKFVLITWLTFSFSFLMLAQTTISFDEATKWTAGSAALGSFASDHTYVDGVFSATGGPALRQATAAQDGFPGALGTYAWRLRDASVSWVITIASGGVADFSVKIRRWDGTPSPAYVLSYSVDEGGNWTEVAQINNETLGATSDWKLFSGIVNSGNLNTKIKLQSTGTTERIMVDDFTWNAYSSAPDVSFEGVKSFFPADDASNVPTDVLYGHLQLSFNEGVSFGAGSIYLRKTSDNTIVRTYNSGSGNWQYGTDGYRTLLLALDHELAASTAYHITIDDDAIVDRAAAPNAFAGIEDATTWNFTTGTSNSITAIADVQTPTGSDDASPMVESKVKVRGVVMFRNNSGFFVQDSDSPYSGIYAYVSGSSVAVGDLVEVYGTIVEYNSFTEFSPVEFIRPISSGNATYLPIEISGEFSEAYESMLVKLANVKVSSVGFVTNKEFTVSDLGEPATKSWTIDDWLYAMSIAPASGSQYESITGMLNHNLGVYKLAPRNVNDFVSLPTAIGVVESDLQSVSYVNGTLVVVSTIDVQSTEIVTLSGSTTAMSMNASTNTGDSDPNGEKGKEIVIPAKAASIGNVQSLSVDRGALITSRIALKQKLASGIYLVKVSLVNGSVLTGKILVR
jgi:hypothetical protein